MSLAYGILTSVAELTDLYEGDFESFESEIEEMGYCFVRNGKIVFIYDELCSENISYGKRVSILNADMFDYEESRENLEYYRSMLDKDVEFVCFHEEKEMNDYRDGLTSKKIIKDLSKIELSDDDDSESEDEGITSGSGSEISQEDEDNEEVEDKNIQSTSNDDDNTAYKEIVERLISVN